jgi:hypothetical protein
MNEKISRGESCPPAPFELKATLLRLLLDLSIA